MKLQRGYEQSEYQVGSSSKLSDIKAFDLKAVANTAKTNKKLLIL